MEFLAGLFAGILVGLIAGMIAADAIQNVHRRREPAPTPRERLEHEQAAPMTPARRDYDRPPYYQPPVIMVLAAPRAGVTVEPPAHSTAVARY